MTDLIEQLRLASYLVATEGRTRRQTGDSVRASRPDDTVLLINAPSDPVVRFR